MLKGRENLLKLALMLMLAFGLYLIVAWASYSPLDNGWSVASSATVSVLNRTGVVGARAIDLLLAMFGDVAVIVPFTLTFVSAYLLLLKRGSHLNRRQVGIWLFGFVLLLVGLSGLFGVLFSNKAYYLAGGFIGGMLKHLLLDSTGQVGVLLFSMVLTSVGLYLCSAQILIQLFNRFYHWIFAAQTNSGHLQDLETLQPLAQANSSESKVGEMQNIPPMTTSALEEEEASAITPSPVMPTTPLTEVSHFVRPTIHGLRQPEPIPTVEPAPSINPNTPSPHTTNSEPERFDFSQFVPEKPILPEIRVPSAENTPIFASKVEEKPRDGVEFERQAESEPVMPTVRLNAASVVTTSAPATIEAQPIEPKLVEPKPVEPVVQAVNIEEKNAKKPFEIEVVEETEIVLPTVKAIPSVSPSVSPSVATPEPAPAPKSYPKSYGDHLIHPLLQPKTALEKPTTPLPTLDLLAQHQPELQNVSEQEVLDTSARIEQELANFGVKATVEDVLIGPVVTRYEIKPAAGVKASKITNLDSDLARALIFKAIRITDVVPGKPYMGIETPNKHRETVWLRDVLASDEFQHSKAILPMALGKSISGDPVVVDMEKMPHLLVAGQTGGGKSVGINTMILSLLYKCTPEQLRFIMIDPKVVELSIYNGIPHLLTPVVTDMKKAENALRWAVEEMDRRYQLIGTLNVRNIEGYNDKIRQADEMNYPIPNPLWRPGDTMDALPPPLEKLSYIVLVVDEFADLMMSAGKQVEDHIMRIAQKARAVGIHLILATQRPSTDVITGVIKANIPSRIAFTVASQIDSRTILDKGGAESLLGRGDMLYSGSGSPEIIRVHGAFMSDDDVQRVADNWRARGKPEYIDSIVESAEEDKLDSGRLIGERDPLFDAVVQHLMDGGASSINGVQRAFGLGFPRAAKIIDQLEAEGILSAPDSRGRREVLVR